MTRPRRARRREIQKLTYDTDITDAIERIHDGYEEDMFDLEGWLLVATDFDRPKEIQMAFERIQ
jgi:hypothetical protein